MNIENLAAATHAKNLEALKAAYDSARAERDDARKAFVGARRLRNALRKAFVDGGCATPDEARESELRRQAYVAARAAWFPARKALSCAEAVLCAAGSAFYAAHIVSKAGA